MSAFDISTIPGILSVTGIGTGLGLVGGYLWGRKDKAAYNSVDVPTLLYMIYACCFTVPGALFLSLVIEFGMRGMSIAFLAFVGFMMWNKISTSYVRKHQARHQTRQAKQAKQTNDHKRN